MKLLGEGGYFWFSLGTLIYFDLPWPAWVIFAIVVIDDMGERGGKS